METTRLMTRYPTIITNPSHTYGAVVTDILNVPYGAHKTVIGAGRISVTTYTPYVWEGLVIMVGYLVISLVVSIIIYNRREI